MTFLERLLQPRQVVKGSWEWSLVVAERTALVTIAVLFMILHVADLARWRYYTGLGLALLGGVATLAFFRIVLPQSRGRAKTRMFGTLLGAALTMAAYALLRGIVPSAHLFFLPMIAVFGLLASLQVALVASAVSVAAYLILAVLVHQPPSPIPALLNSGIFILTGFVSGVLSQELRAHYRREMSESRLASALGHRLSAVIDAVEEAVVFSDRNGMARVLNERMSEMFGIDLGAHLGEPVVQVLRVLARQTEDPEGFMERFQELRDDPEAELRFQIEQIIPQRRVLRVLSRPARAEDGRLVGRIDVYVDVTEVTRRAAEAERLLEEARKTAESYQRALLPTAPPNLPRIGLVAHYIPAAGAKAVCGDFYDFISMQNGRMALALGDVTGIGPDAVNDAALTRYTLGSVAGFESDPAEMLTATNRLVARRLGFDRFVRLFVGVLDPERAQLKYASAGHVPPIVYRAATGEIEWLSEVGPPLGASEAPAYRTQQLELDPGDTLFLYTDGVTEATRFDRPLGQGKLSDLVRQYGVGTPGELVQAIRRAVENWVEGDLRDDIAMVGLEVVPDTEAAEPTRELVLPNEASRTAEVRRFIADFLADLRAPVEVSSEILLAAGEAVGNCVKYGRSQEGRSEIRVRCVLDGQDVSVSIADEGEGFDPGEMMLDDLPDPFAQGGRGLFLMRQLMDDVSIDSSGSGTTVVLRRRAFAKPPLPSARASRRDD